MQRRVLWTHGERRRDPLDGAGAPRLVLVREPDQLGVERAHPQLAFGARLVELAKPNCHVAANDDRRRRSSSASQPIKSTRVNSMYGKKSTRQSDGTAASFRNLEIEQRSRLWCTGLRCGRELQQLAILAVGEHVHRTVLEHPNVANALVQVPEERFLVDDLVVLA